MTEAQRQKCQAKVNFAHFGRFSALTAHWNVDIASKAMQRSPFKDSTALAQWARFYDLETGKPFFCDRDGIKKARWPK